MEILVVGNLRGNVERLEGLVEVSSPDYVFVLGTSGISSPVNLPISWFYVRGKEDSIELLAKSNGVDILSRVFMTKEGISFSGISGVYNPSTIKFSRAEWLKIKGKIDKSKQNCIFLDDIETFKHYFKKSRLPRLDVLLLSDDPFRFPLKEVVALSNPKFVFFPSSKYLKEKLGNTVYIGLEPVTSEKGKYVLRF